MIKKMISIFRRTREQDQGSLSYDQAWQYEHQGYLQGNSDGYLRGKQEGFDEGFAEGYNEGEIAGIAKAKSAALQTLTNGEDNGKQTGNNQN